MSIVISDIDGTILRNGMYPIQSTVDKLNAAPGRLVLITGRMENTRVATERVLNHAGLRSFTLLMNSIGPAMPDQRKSKLQHAQTMANRDVVATAIDNDPAMRKLYVNAGISKRVTSP